MACIYLPSSLIRFCLFVRRQRTLCKLCNKEVRQWRHFCVCLWAINFLSVPHIYLFFAKHLLFVFFIVLVFLHFLLLAKVKLTFFLFFYTFFFVSFVILKLEYLHKERHFSVCLSVCLYFKLLEQLFLTAGLRGERFMEVSTFFSLKWNVNQTTSTR